MIWTSVHADLLNDAFEKLLGHPEAGTIAFVRCLSPDVIGALANAKSFAPSGWVIWCVADSNSSDSRTLTADRAVEIREAKAEPVLLLVDTAKAGAGMDGIYSAAREIDERSLFGEALPLAQRAITRKASAAHRQYAELAVKRARFGRRLSISLWTEFDYLCRVASDQRHPGELLHVLGLWPVERLAGTDAVDDLMVSRFLLQVLPPRGELKRCGCSAQRRNSWRNWNRLYGKRPHGLYCRPWGISKRNELCGSIPCVSRELHSAYRASN
jgi:hypothetical protein